MLEVLDDRSKLRLSEESGDHPNVCFSVAQLLSEPIDTLLLPLFLIHHLDSDPDELDEVMGCVFATMGKLGEK